jgi:hypothetical protein
MGTVLSRQQHDLRLSRPGVRLAGDGTLVRLGGFAVVGGVSGDVLRDWCGIECWRNRQQLRSWVTSFACVAKSGAGEDVDRARRRWRRARSVPLNRQA